MDKLDTFMDKCHALDIRCNAILLEEFKQPIYADPTGSFLTFELLRSQNIHQEICGFTHVYLQQAINRKIEVKLEVVVQLAESDLRRGAKLAEIVCSCCQFMPTIEFIDKSRV